MTRFALLQRWFFAFMAASATCFAQETSERETLPFPGHAIPEGSNSEIDAIIFQWLQDQVDERDARVDFAQREARRLRREYNEIARSDDSPRMLFQAGYRFLQCEEWDAADEAFRRVIDTHTDSIWSLEARLCLFDMAFEIDCDPSDVETLLDDSELLQAAVASQTEESVAPVVPPMAQSHPISELPIQVPGPQYTFGAEFRIVVRPSSEVYRDLLVRRAVWAILQGEVDSARELYTEATEINHNIGGPFTSVSHLVYSGHHFWMSSLESGDSDPKAALLILYSDLLFHGDVQYRSHRMLGRLLDHPELPLTDLQRSCLHFQRAMARFRMPNLLERLPGPIVEDFLLCQALAPDSRWAPDALVRAGHTEWTLDYADPVAIEYWQKVIDEYPDSPFAPEAAEYMGMFHDQQENWADAYRAYRLIRDHYKDSHYYESAGERLVEIRPLLPESFFVESAEPMP